MVIMARYRKKTDLEIALSPVVSGLGHMPTPKEMSRLIGGDPRDWGRIFKGQQNLSGEYHARLELLKKDGIDTAQFEFQAAEKSKKYGGRTRKGRIVPHTRHIFDDLYEFNINRILDNRMSARTFEDTYDGYIFYSQEEMDIYAHGEQYPRTYFEEQTLRRDFINDL